MQIKKSNLVIMVKQLAYLTALGCLIGAVIFALLTKTVIYEWFGVVAFLAVTFGIVIEYFNEIL